MRFKSQMMTGKIEKNRPMNIGLLICMTENRKRKRDSIESPELDKDLIYAIRLFHQ